MFFFASSVLYLFTENEIVVVLICYYPMYRVFLGAPSKADIHNDASSYKWNTISSSDSNSKSTRLATEGTPSLIFPLATLEAASHRISLIYKNIIFDDASELEAEDLTKGIGLLLGFFKPSL